VPICPSALPLSCPPALLPSCPSSYLLSYYEAENKIKIKVKIKVRGLKYLYKLFIKTQNLVENLEFTFIINLGSRI